jgi:hypothetical protein
VKVLVIRRSTNESGKSSILTKTLLFSLSIISNYPNTLGDHPNYQHPH